jgi:hypothetical protein
VAAVGRRVSTLCKGEDGVRQQLALYHVYYNFECVPPFTHGLLWGYAVHYTDRDSCTLRCRVPPAC